MLICRENKSKALFIHSFQEISVIFFLPSLLWSACIIGLLVVDINSFVVSSLLVAD